ncbi:MAG: hotdog domain-containing protein [Acidimicrobiales bacterium]
MSGPGPGHPDRHVRPAGDRPDPSGSARTEAPAAPRPSDPDPRHHVSEYFRLQRWEIPPEDGAEQMSEFGGRSPVEDHQRSAAGGLLTGGLLTSVDSLGGMAAGLAVLPRWIVTTSMMATVGRLSHQGPLRFHARVVRRGRNSVVVGLDVVDEGDADVPVAAVTMTCAVLDPDGIDLHFERPMVVDMPPPSPDPRTPEEFFCIEPGRGPVTRLELADRLRNPWGILHGGAVAVLADVAARRAVASRPSSGGADAPVADPDLLATGDTVLHYLRPVKVGPVEARCDVLGGGAGPVGTGRNLVRVAIHDVGADDRLVELATVAVLAV